MITPNGLYWQGINLSEKQISFTFFTQIHTTPNPLRLSIDKFRFSPQIPAWSWLRIDKNAIAIDNENPA